jgi:hypothetical protein
MLLLLYEALPALRWLQKMFYLLLGYNIGIRNGVMTCGYGQYISHYSRNGKKLSCSLYPVDRVPIHFPILLRGRVPCSVHPHVSHPRLPRGINPLKASRNYEHIGTTCFLTINNSAFCPQSVYVCFVQLSHRTAIIS